MNCIRIRFYGDLNDFLLPKQGQRAFTYCFKDERSIKDLIESLGVPHVEVGLLLIDGEPEDFSQLVFGGEQIAVYPHFTRLDLSSLPHVQPEPLSEFRFVLDVHLGKLASSLRMLGFDTFYRNDAPDDELAAISAKENRILLTFDRQLLKRKNVNYGYLVRSRDPDQQVVEILKRFNLFDRQRPFRRCMVCNGLLRSASREEVEDSIPENVRQTLNEFSCCPSCGRVYWKGSHYQRMQRAIEKFINQT